MQPGTRPSSEHYKYKCFPDIHAVMLYLQLSHCVRGGGGWLGGRGVAAWSQGFGSAA